MRALFVCLHNAGRSQMAEVFARRAGIDARSAGSTPAERIHPEVAVAMLEVGVDLAGHSPRVLTRQDLEWAEVVVTMGCGDTCPSVGGGRHIDWDVPDPKGLSLDEVRRIRDGVERRVEELVAEYGRDG